jgi:hypothetical protein
MVWAILNPDQNTALKELIKGQNSDRVVAILGGVMLDDSLRRALELRFRKSDGMNDKIFRVTGALGNLGPKIDIAYQLYMFEKPMLNALHALAEIRNLFAHQMDMRFSSDATKMKEAIAKLTLHEGKTYYPSATEDSDTTYRLETIHQTRDLFIVNLKLALIWLMSDRGKHAPGSNFPVPVFRPPAVD